jgi:1-acyl-sn-glycerol-3-phosphate acyltransferase
MMFLLGIKFELKQMSQLPPPPYVICSNHTSFIDIPVIYFIFSDYFKFMAKRELIYVPFFNVFFLKMNITVNRKSRKDSHRAYKEASATIQSGNGICIFPEGTISKHCPKMINFKNGAFKLAIEHQVPIVPVTLLNNWNILRDDSFFSPNASPGKSIAIIHESIPTAGLNEESLEVVKQQCFEVINAPLIPFLQKD